MMRAREILQEYEKGRRDFQGVSLQGLSFKGEDLSGADFSGADIRGTNFRGAILTGAKFQGAKAGLQKRWVIVLLASALVLALVSGIFTLIGLVVLWVTYNSDNPEEQNAGLVALALLVIFWVTIIRDGVGKVAAIGTVAFAFTVSGIGAIAFVWPVAGAGIGTVAFTVAGAITFPGTVAVAGAITFAGTVVAAGFLGKTSVVTFALTGIQILLSAYTAYQAIKGDEKYTLILRVAADLAAIGGTSFRDADLTDTDFTHATLKSTDFRGANITRTCWKNTIKLDLIRPGETYLKDAKIRQLVRTADGQGKNFDRLDLRGINLRGANLQNASFDGTDLNRANLENADLSRAKLVQTLLEGADLTRANLTGACVENWGISNTTKLIDINCDYIFLKYPENERRPADPEKYFEPGEFAKLVQKIPNIVDLVFNDCINWQTFVQTFQELRVESETGEEFPVIQIIENKGDGAFVIRVKVAEYERKIPNTVDLIFKDGIDWQAFLQTFQELQVESETGE